MKYQVEYDRLLLAEAVFQSEETGEWISGVSFSVRFGTVFERESDGLEKVALHDSYFSLSDLLTVCYSKKTKQFDFQLDEAYTEGIEIVAYFIDTDPSDQGMFSQRQCTKEEFEQIIANYGDRFTDDPALQCCSYGIHEVADDMAVSKITQPPPRGELSTGIQLLEEMLHERKQRIDEIPRVGVMAEQYRSECLTHVSLIEAAENKKEWLIDQETTQESFLKLSEEYLYLIELYEHYFRFLSQEGLYTSVGK